MGYHKDFSTRQTPQSQPIPGRETEMVKNEAGGYAFPVTDWVRLERFLILGAENGTYYIGKKELVIQNAQAAVRCLRENPRRVIDLIVDVSINYRAAKSEPAIFVLAMACSMQFVPKAEDREYAFSKLNEVTRIGTFLFQFASAMEAFRGWGRLATAGIANWYNSKPAWKVAFQAVKYQQRGGWAHRDLLRLSHPKPPTENHNLVYRWMLGIDIDEEVVDSASVHSDLRTIRGFELAKIATTSAAVVKLIEDYRLTREMIPTRWLKSQAVWEALLERMPPMAMIRNLGKLTNVGVIAPFSDGLKHVVAKLGDRDYLHKARVHPWAILNALYWYNQGHGMMGNLQWRPVSTIVDTLDGAFHASFGNVEPTNKNIAVCIDISGSMSYAHITAGKNSRGAVKGMAAAQAAGAMALITARVEPHYEIFLFNTGIRTANISKHSTMGDVFSSLQSHIGGGTDYSAPIVYAMQNNIPIDTFVIYGDEQSWRGRIHPTQAIQAYRDKLGRPTKLIIVNMCSTSTTVTDPKDGGTINLIGFDTNTPKIISEYS